jgi:hypothetical protein
MDTCRRLPHAASEQYHKIKIASARSYDGFQTDDPVTWQGAGWRVVPSVWCVMLCQPTLRLIAWRKVKLAGEVSIPPPLSNF